MGLNKKASLTEGHLNARWPILKMWRSTDKKDSFSQFLTQIHQIQDKTCEICVIKCDLRRKTDMGGIRISNIQLMPIFSRHYITPQ